MRDELCREIVSDLRCCGNCLFSVKPRRDHCKIGFEDWFTESHVCCSGWEWDGEQAGDRMFLEDKEELK